MLSNLFYTLFVFGVCTPIFLLIGGQSLAFYVSKQKISAEAIRIFAAGLRFPFDLVYFKNTGADNLLTTTSKLLPEEYLLQASYTQSRNGKIVGSLIPIVVILLCVRNIVTDRSNDPLFLYYLLTIFSLSLGLYFSWHFGHKIVAIQAELNAESHNTD